MFINFPENATGENSLTLAKLRSDLEVAFAVGVPDKTGRRQFSALRRDNAKHRQSAVRRFVH